MATQPWLWRPRTASFPPKSARAFLLSLIAVLLLCPAATAQSVDVERLNSAIQLAANYLVDQTQPNGQFIYRVNTNPNVLVRPKYNMLRHAGAMFALADYQRSHASAEVIQALKSANSFLQTQVKPLDDVPGTLAVWSDREVNFGDDPLKAKLGGAGLGLVAMCELEKIVAESTPKERLADLGNFVLFMQKDSGGFYSIYYPIFPGRDDEWTSLYYPGEAALGLLVLNDVMPQRDWVRGAQEALLFLAKERRGRKEVPADHWALIATAKLLADSHAIAPQVRSALLHHVEQIVEFMLQEQAGQKNNGKLDGSFVADGRTTPTATRLEGLLAASRVLPGDHRLKQPIHSSIQHGVRFLIRSQIKSGKYSGGVPRAIGPLPDDGSKLVKEFNARSTEIRIDYVQHALSAFVGYQRSLADEAQK